MGFKGAGKTKGLYLATTIIFILIGAYYPAMTRVCGMILTDGVIGNNEIDGRNKGILWTEWEIFFGLRSKGELIEQGAL